MQFIRNHQIQILKEKEINFVMTQLLLIIQVDLLNIYLYKLNYFNLF